jgi:GWxTD domain-containing protein
MKGLILAARTPVFEALGWTIFHSLWEGLLVAAALASVLAVLRSSRLRYAAGCAALLIMLAGFVLTLIHVLPPNDGHARMPIPASLPPWRELPNDHGSADGFPGFGVLIPWLAPAWLAGVCLFYIRAAAGWLPLYHWRRRGVLHASDPWQRFVTRWAAQMRILRPVVLLESLLIDMPVVVGHFRPVILVPLGFLSGLPPEHVEAILLHELAHIRRSDYLLNICQRLIEGLFFYHPAAWWISRVIRAEREHCCDDAAVALRGDAHSYAVALTALEGNRLEPKWPLRELTVTAAGGNLMKRIRRLLYPQGPSGLWAPVLAAIILTASTAMTLAAWHASPHPSAGAAQTSNPAENHWQKWLNEDVVYLISDREKAAFENLKTDEERQHFADQFWTHRDPTPGTPENEFKKEHYRRIAYANDHYRTASGTPGWRTDRGHMYIVYGPPDEIDSHPKTADNAYGIESWLYRHVEGLGDERSFTFTDRTGAGDYRLAPSAVK